MCRIRYPDLTLVGWMLYWRKVVVVSRTYRTMLTKRRHGFVLVLEIFRKQHLELCAHAVRGLMRFTFHAVHTARAAAHWDWTQLNYAYRALVREARAMLARQFRRGRCLPWAFDGLVGRAAEVRELSQLEAQW